MSTLQESADSLAAIWSRTYDADEMYAAMQWLEVESLAWMLFHAGHAEVAAQIGETWRDANGPEDVEGIAGERLVDALRVFQVAT